MRQLVDCNEFSLLASAETVLENFVLTFAALAVTAGPRVLRAKYSLDMPPESIPTVAAYLAELASRPVYVPRGAPLNSLLTSIAFAFTCQKYALARYAAVLLEQKGLSGPPS